MINPWVVLVGSICQIYLKIVGKSEKEESLFLKEGVNLLLIMLVCDVKKKKGVILNCGWHTCVCKRCRLQATSFL